MIFLRRNSNTLPHGFPSLSETFQLVRTLCQVSPDGDSLTPSDWPVTGPLAGPLRSVEGLPSRNIQLERKKNTAVCRYPQTHSFWRLAGILPYIVHNRRRLPNSEDSLGSQIPLVPFLSRRTLRRADNEVMHAITSLGDIPEHDMRIAARYSGLGFKWERWTRPHPDWDHDHCFFCYACICDLGKPG